MFVTTSRHRGLTRVRVQRANTPVQEANNLGGEEEEGATLVNTGLPGEGTHGPRTREKLSASLLGSGCRSKQRWPSCPPGCHRP